MKAKLQDKYENVMLYFIAFSELIKRMFVNIYPVTAPVVAIILVIGYAGSVDVGSLSLQQFLYYLFATAIIFLLTTLFYFHIKKGRRNN